MALGVGSVLLGVLWVGEWLGYFKGSFLIDSRSTGWAGALAIVAGGVVASWGWRIAGRD